MAGVVVATMKTTVGAPLVPDLPFAGEPAIDLVHLARMTLGDRSLEREVLQLFDRQADLLVGRLAAADAGAVGALAHTLKGSARGIGAWRVARAAEALEQAAAGDAGALALAKQRVASASADARAMIADLLQAA